jgi:hypothetical protein
MYYATLGPDQSPTIDGGPWKHLDTALENCPPGRRIWDSSANKYLSREALRAGRIEWRSVEVLTS